MPAFHVGQRYYVRASGATIGETDGRKGRNQKVARGRYQLLVIADIGLPSGLLRYGGTSNWTSCALHSRVCR